MSKSRTQTWLALIVLAVGLHPRGDCGALVVHERHCDAPAPEPAGRAIRGSIRHPSCDSGPTRSSRGGRSSVRVSPSRTCRDFRWRSVPVARSCGPKALAGRISRSGCPSRQQTRFRIGTASTALTSAAVGLLLEKDRLKLDEKIQTYVPEFPEKQWPVTLRQLMGHMAGVANDGGDEGPLFTERCERPVDALQFFSGHERELLFEPGTRYHYSSYGWILVSAAVETAADEPFFTFMRKQIFEPLGMDDTRADSATEPIPDRATPYFPRFAADPRYGLHLMRAARLFLLRGIQRIPVHSVRPGALRYGDQQRQAAATRHGAITPDATATGLGARRRVTVLAGTSRPLRWRVNKRAWSATTGSRWAGWWRLS